MIVLEFLGLLVAVLTPVFGQLAQEWADRRRAYADDVDRHLLNRDFRTLSADLERLFNRVRRPRQR